MNTTRKALILPGSAAAIPMSLSCVSAAVMGKNFHYLFEAPEAIKAILLSDLRDLVDVSFHPFVVDAEQRISGSYFLRIGKSATAEQKEKALAAGFRALPSGDLNANGSLTGTRYAANGVQATNPMQKLRKPYTVNVSAEKSAGSKSASTAGKLLLTLITLAADGVLILVAVPLLLIVAIGASTSR